MKVPSTLIKQTVFFLMLTTMAACSSTRVYTSTSAQDIMQNGIIQQPKVAYLNVDAKHKITGKSHINAKAKHCPSVDDMKQQAEYDALKTNGCDVIVEPMYKVEITDQHKRREIDVEVTGFPGKYTDFKDIKEVSKEDMDALKLYGSILRSTGQTGLVKTSGESSSNTTGSMSPAAMLKMMSGGKKK